MLTISCGRVLFFQYTNCVANGQSVFVNVIILGYTIFIELKAAKYSFWKKVILKKKSADGKTHTNYPACNEKRKSYNAAAV